MTETIEEKQEESLKDYASRRLVELKNAEQKFVQNINNTSIALEQSKANLIACKARINEMERIITGDNSPLPAKP